MEHRAIGTENIHASRAARAGAQLARGVVLAIAAMGCLACGATSEPRGDAGVLDAGEGPGDAGEDAATPPEDAPSDAGASDAGPPPPGARVLVLARDGRGAAVDLGEPFAVEASFDLGAPIASARCLDGTCVVVHPSPDDALSVLDPTAPSSFETITLDPGADPQDVYLLDAHRALVSLRGSASLRLLDLDTGGSEPIDLSALADSDGLPEAGRIAGCGAQVFVQLARIDASTGLPSALGPVLGVLELSRSAGERVIDVDPVAPGVQGIALTYAAAFDMPIDCEGGHLLVPEPQPLFSGGGTYELVDLATYEASPAGLDSGAQVGGVERVRDDLHWRITHTEFGPGASSHLELVGGATPFTYNTFSGEHVDELALDRPLDLLFFPDPCVWTPSNAGCEPGLHVFVATTAAAAHELPIDVGFPPIEVAVSRPAP